MNSDSVWRMVRVPGPLFFLPVQQPARDCGRRRRKKWYFIIFSLRICLGCARRGPCFVGPTGPGPGVPPFWTQKWQEVPKCSKLLFRLQKRSAEVVEGVFETLEHHIFSQTCLFAALDLSSCRNDKNETAIFQKSQFFRVCPVTDTQTENRSAWQPPAPRRKFASRGRALASPLQ